MRSVRRIAAYARRSSTQNREGAPVGGPGGHVGGLAEHGGQRAGDGVVVAFGHDEQQAGVGRVGQADVRRRRHHVEVDAGRADHDDAVADSGRGLRRPQVAPGQRRRHGLQTRHTDQLGPTHQHPTQPLCGGQVGRAVAADNLDRSTQRLDRRTVAVDHALRLAVVLADTDFEATVDDAAHLQPQHLPVQHAVLGYRLGARLHDRRGERQVDGWLLRGRRRNGESPVDPHLRRRRETGRPSRPCTGQCLGRRRHVQLGHAVLASPRDRVAQGVEFGLLQRAGYCLPRRRPYRRSNRSTRPPVSTSFCLPV